MASIDCAEFEVAGLAYRYIRMHSTSLGVELTKAEREVAQLLCSGLSTKQIASSRNVSPNTVTNQLTSLYAKLRVRSRHELVALLQAGVS